MHKLKMTGRAWAYVGVTLGGVVSIAANVAHSYVPPFGAPAGWAPHTGAVLGAVFWPTALFVALEILARTDWRSGARWIALRFGGLLPVAVFAAVVSYRHLSGLLTYYGEDWVTATFGPLAVDGLMVMSTGSLIATARKTADPEPATVAVTRPVTVASPPPAAPPAAPQAQRPPRRSPRKSPPKTPDTAAEIAKLRAKKPAITQAEAVAKLGVSERTVQRYWNPDTAPATPAVNGTPVLPDTAAPAAT